MPIRSSDVVTRVTTCITLEEHDVTRIKEEAETSIYSRDTSQNYVYESRITVNLIQAVVARAGPAFEPALAGDAAADSALQNGNVLPFHVWVDELGLLPAVRAAEKVSAQGLREVFSAQWIVSHC